MKAKVKGQYVDGFVLTIPEDRIADYKKIATKAGKIWREHGALEYRECIADDMDVEMGIPFPKLSKARPGEVVVFAWIVYKSKADRNKVNKKVMSDERLQCMDPNTMPFDCKRMTYGGFKILVDAN